MKKSRSLFRVVPVFAFLFIFALTQSLPAKGKIEFGLHYGSWSLNLLKSAIESMADDFAEQIKNKQFDKIQEDNPDADLREISFKNEVEFDSSGHNYGFEIRWYPAGENGSFSLGLSVEKTKIKFGLPKVTTDMSVQNVKNGDIYGFQANASGTVESNPLAFLLSFRWDILPRARIHPYFTFGFGMAGVSALDETTLTYDFSGVLQKPGEAPETVADSGSKTLKQLKEEDEQRKLEEGSTEEPFDYPIKFFPFLMLHFGLKGKVTENIHLLVDFGILDGFVLRGGVAFRI
jgi:hypothetical protein